MEDKSIISPFTIKRPVNKTANIPAPQPLSSQIETKNNVLKKIKGVNRRKMIPAQILLFTDRLECLIE